MGKKEIIVEGKNYEEAVSKGLEELKLKFEEVVVETLEEKTSLFLKKKSIRLKITEKQVNAEKSSLNLGAKRIIEEGQHQAIKTLTSCSDEDFFRIDYLTDGLYMTVRSSTTKNLQEKTKEVLAYLEKKSVIELNIEAVHQCLEGNPDNPIKIAPHQEEHLIDGTVVIDISKDKLEAYITITKADGGKEINFQEVKGALEEKGVVYGIDETRLHTMIDYGVFDEKILIAEGKKPEVGEDGKVEYHVDIHKQYKPQILEDGTVDFKQLDLIANVVKGQLLVEIIPPTDGIQGINVFQQEIPPQKGKPAKIGLGKNVVGDEEGLKIYSQLEGQAFLRDGKLQVSQVYEVPGDVGHSTGNIKFNGTVVVKGNIKSGFVVKADGDIQVNGVVEAATLIAKGNIILNRGIQGSNQAYLECENLVAKYIENTKIKSLANIESDCILHSDVIAKKNITVVGRRGLIVGGQVRAGEEIRAKVIGSHMGTSTKIEVGIDPEEKSNYEETKLEISEIEKNLMNLRKTIELLNKMAQNSTLEESKKEILVKSIKTYEYLKEKHKFMISQLKAFELRAQDLSKGKIHASMKIYPGVRVSILNAARHIYDELSMCTLYVKEGEIAIGPHEQ